MGSLEWKNTAVALVAITTCTALYSDRWEDEEIDPLYDSAIGIGAIAIEESSDQPALTEGVASPPKGGKSKRVCSQSNYFLKYDMLYWEAKQQGLGFINDPSTVLVTSDFTKKSRTNPESEWNFGFRLGVGYQPSAFNWLFDLTWTSFSSRAHLHKQESVTEGMFPFFTLQKDIFEGDYATFAKMHWSIRFNLLDLNAHFTPRCRKRNEWGPFVSIRNVWIMQKERVVYEGGSFNAGEDVVKLHSTFYGIGPRIGIAPRFFLGDHLGFYGMAAVAGFYGFFDVAEKETFVDVKKASIHRDPSGFRWNVDCALGILWQEAISVSKFRLDVDIGGDYLFFNHQNEFKYSPEHVSHQGKDLNLFGFHVGVLMRF